MPANIRNWFGLPYLSAKLAYYHYGDGGTGSGLTTTVLSAGTTLSLPGDDIYSLADNAYSDIYLETAQPQFQTVKYCFYRTDYNWLPGSAQFTPTNDSPMLMKQYPGTATWYATNDLPFLIVPAGGWTQLAGYAKLAVLNGYPDVYAYLGQYFDQAYKVDANGNVTTNITGIVSPYGNYFATDAGVAALVTMPDLDTPYQRGTCTVYSVSLQFDKNHDGIMDSAWNGPDATSQASPMVAWVNSGHTEPGSNGGLDIDKAVPPATTNYLAQQITCQRDLENFFRLWICGVPTLAFSNGYSATITCTAITGTPAINIYLAETNGGTLYLTDTNVAQSLVNEFAMGTAGTGSGQTCILPNDFFDGKNKYLLFEGAGIGEGQFTLTIYQGTTAIAQTSTFIDLHDVKDLYEQAHIANVATTYPAMVNSTNASIFVVDHPSPMNSVGTNQMIVFVHGWRMTQFNYYSFSESMFKRLYWAGYQGRFAALKWPTLSADTSGDISQYFTYNRSEHIAFDSGVGASAYFDSLKARFSDYSINVAAHSMGNIVMMETLKNQLAAGHTAIDNYVLMQAAAPAHCYQSSLPDYGRFTTAEANHHTPDVYRGYPGAINGALNGKMVNFFNTNDYALATGVYLGVQANWEKNQVDNKPDSYWSYTTDGTNADCYYGNHRVITNPRELMPFVARPRSQAIGARAGVAGVIQGGEVDLTGQFNFFGGSDEHSAQFNWNIQKLDPFYRKLLTTFFPPQ
jgi:pimeloyl-ACP methyl ester carboxylesterase